MFALGFALLVQPAVPAASDSPIDCVGEHIQGATLICRTLPGAGVSLGDITVTADEAGYVILGHDRDAPEQTELRVSAGGLDFSRSLDVTQREYEIQRIDGVPQEYVTPPEETLARIRSEGARKAQAYTSRWQGSGFLDGFVMPAEGPITGVYGSQRIFNGEPRRPHYGLDVAAGEGTDVHAPAPGLVTLADGDMYYEGGLIFIDHGQGFTSGFLHLSEVSVEAGDRVEAGDVIGAVGSGGRSTGAHLDWRIKWHNRYIDPALTLELDPTVLAD
ncbi:M23 family metallopeptidase [Marinicauda pacifica]|uniref:M23 family metallopeptidase n=1 Tax=Marinicauda pacifica TaxID=1133559 RepID=A0A4S2HDN7_9PROT|nr:M23 family metallopeptidase [Marinicauda pacifica]TGY93963.1 M23 family metallopeptidase [Marinicauda pacifica]